MNPPRSFPPARDLAPLVLLLIVGLLSGGCGSLQVATASYTVRAVDGYPLQGYTNFEWRGGKRAWKEPTGVVYYVQGSEDETVLNAVGRFAGAAAMGMDVVMMERRGVQKDGSVDEAVALASATKGLRIADHLAVIRTDLQSRPTGFPAILVGASEGGDVAAAIAVEEPRLTHLVLLGSGGGMSQTDELRQLVRRDESAFGIGGEKKLEAAFEEIRVAPDSDRMWLGHPYRRWSSFLFDAPIDDLLQLDIPILLVQGDSDVNVPVESARAARDAFEAAKKTNLRYVELAGVDHRFTHLTTDRHALPLIEIALVNWLADAGTIDRSKADQFIKRVKNNHKEWFGPGAPQASQP